MSEGYAHVATASTEEEAVSIARQGRPDVRIFNQPTDVSRDEALRMAADGVCIRASAQLGEVLILGLGSPAAA